ncbi:MAG: thiamine diphosphokinase [Paraprevotella sp.]|nr:thiamine diphosphokinase [Paraprevotella sp.]
MKNNKEYKCVIIGNGEFPKNDDALNLIYNAEYICCCDGAAELCIRHGIRPKAIVGDGDSLSESFKSAYKDILYIEEEQEDNDLTKATRHCIRQGYRNIAYIGATGKREDHTIGNVSLMERYLREFGINVIMITDYGYFIPANGSHTFDTFCGQQVSIFNFTCNKIESKGLKWQSYNYRSWWQGSLNEAIGNEIEIIADGSYIVYFTHHAKRLETNK